MNKIKIFSADVTDKAEIKTLRKKVERWLDKGAEVTWLQSSADTTFDDKHVLTAVVTYRGKQSEILPGNSGLRVAKSPE